MPCCEFPFAILKNTQSYAKFGGGDKKLANGPNDIIAG